MPARTQCLAYRPFSLLLAALLWTLLVPALTHAADAAKGEGPAKADELAKPAEADKPTEVSQTATPVKAAETAKVDPLAKANAAPKAPEAGKTGKAAKDPARAKAGRSAAKAKGKGEADAEAKAKEKVPVVAVDPAQDPDFALEGEYMGPISTAPSKYEPLGLQVRPMGGGSFEAIQYLGGLLSKPSRQTPVTLIGKRFEGFVVLSGGPWAVFVEPDHCLLVDRQGERVGRLERVFRQSPSLGAPPTKDAIVLFDGKGTEQFTTARVTDDGLLMEGATIKPMLQDFNLHAEFMLPYMPAGRDQGRGNSGIYLQSRYEVQILDSFAEEPVFNGCGSLYRFRKPDVNMCLPPLVWQTYDIVFTAARWAADETKLKNARVTIWLNGVKVHNNVELVDKTGAGKPEEPTLLPTSLQDHHNPVRFRNVWIVDRGAAPATNFPVFAKPAGNNSGKATDAAAKREPAKKQPAVKKERPARKQPAGKEPDEEKASR